MGRLGFVFFDFIDFAGTNFGTVSTATAFFAIYHWVHNLLVVIRILSALVPKIPSSNFQMTQIKMSKKP